MNMLILWIGFFISISCGVFINFFFKKKYLYKYNLFQQSCFISIIWVVISFCFSIFLWIYFFHFCNSIIANKKVISFLFGYIVEKLLSVDNVLTWLLLFKYLDIPISLQNRVLMYGVFGAIILRSVLILSGYWCLLHWHWIIFLFGLILLFTGLEMILPENKSEKIFQDNLILKYIKKIFRVTNSLYKEKFFLYDHGKWYITPLFMTLIMVELSDIIFASDSIPAIFSITQDPFIIVSSNIFAVFGLRAMYFVISSIIDRCNYIKPILSIILILIAFKMLFLNFEYVLHSVFAIFFSIILIIVFIYTVIIRHIL